jgi:hypothetical protein
MEAPSKFDQLVLDASYNDYEAPHTIASDLSNILGRPVPEQEVRSAFGRLVHLGLVQAFHFDAATQQYRSVQSALLPSVQEPWFLAVRS